MTHEHEDAASVDPYDPFRQARETTGTLDAHEQGISFTMFLRHADLRRIARDYPTFTSATPFRVPIPPEHDIRPTAQLPIESDPPMHTSYRELMEERFSRGAMAMHDTATRLVADTLLDAALANGTMEVVGQLGLPLFLRTLALVLGRPQSDVAQWLTWGTQALAAQTEHGVRGNTDLNRYIDAAVDAAAESPADDFFSELARSSLDGRPLTRDEMRGFANLTFAGGRQTVVYALTNVVHHLARQPTDLRTLADEPHRITVAIEEFLRFMTPITHLGRTATRDVEVAGRDISSGELVSICFASANRDEAAFDAADELHLDRRPNRHVAFGHGPHTCVGAPMARLVLQVALEQLVARCSTLELAEAVPHHETIGDISVRQGYDRLVVRVHPRGRT
jgi:cytochrome P450